MNTYEQSVKEAELALNNGEYEQCIKVILPFLEIFSVSSKEGINTRMLLITAYSGINKNDEALKICKQLVKSQSPQIRENAKSLIQIIGAPELKAPENWNIKFENNLNDYESNNYKKSIKKKTKDKKKFINISEIPTGETQSFKSGFLIVTFILLILLFNLLGGCVRIQNNLDFRNIDSINMKFEINSKYINKIPWQLNFEKKLKSVFSNSIISTSNETFSIEDQKMSLNETKNKLNKIIKIASDVIPLDLSDIQIEHYEKNYFIAKKHLFKIIMDLRTLDKMDDLEITININNPSKPNILNEIENVNIFKNEINWKLIYGQMNSINFSFWSLNRLFISLILSTTLVSIGYILRINRYELGSDLPELPS